VGGVKLETMTGGDAGVSGMRVGTAGGGVRDGEPGTTGAPVVLLEGGRPPGTATGEICPGGSGSGGMPIGPPEVTGCKVENRGEGIVSGPGPIVIRFLPRLASAASTRGISGRFNSWGVGSPAAVGASGRGDSRLPQRARAQLTPSVSSASPRTRRTGWLVQYTLSPFRYDMYTA
jgi:hypothetical protein